MNKNTFEMNDLNNYLSLRQGKKHFWGIKGKDYGFVQSRANQQRSQGIPELKQHYAKVSRHNYDLENLHQGHEEPFSSYERSKDFQFPREKKKMEFIEHYDEGQSKKRQLMHHRTKTEPINYFEDYPQYSKAEDPQTRKKNLSLKSKNIEVSLQNPKFNQVKRYSTIDYSLAQQRPGHQVKILPKRISTQGNVQEQLQKYRERIVKVVRRDRRNNPTFCNSLAYPLPCYRYVQ